MNSQPIRSHVLDTIVRIASWMAMLTLMAYPLWTGEAGSASVVRASGARASADVAPIAKPTAQPPRVLADVNDTTLAELINQHRVANGRRPLQISYQLTQVAAVHVQILMLNINSDKVISTAKLMPGNYSWQTVSFWGNDSSALRVNTAQAAFGRLSTNTRKNLDILLSPDHHDLGAVWLCNGRMCAYFIILGH